jgi:hypothetical protein
MQGGVAQLGERYNRTVEVGGSSPPASTLAKDGNDPAQCRVVLVIAFVSDDLLSMSSIRRLRPQLPGAWRQIALAPGR